MEKLAEELASMNAEAAALNAKIAIEEAIDAASNAPDGPLDGIIGKLERLFEEIRDEGEESERMLSRATLEINYLRGELRRQLPWNEYQDLIENFHKDVLAGVPRSMGGYHGD